MQGDSVKGLRMEYLGKKVLYGGKAYTVVEVGQDGELLIFASIAIIHIINSDPKDGAISGLLSLGFPAVYYASRL